MLHPSLALAAMLTQPPGRKEVAENVFGALLGKFSVHLPQTMTPCSWGTGSEDERKSELLLSVAAPA